MGRVMQMMALKQRLRNARTMVSHKAIRALQIRRKCANHEFDCDNRSKELSDSFRRRLLIDPAAGCGAPAGLSLFRIVGSARRPAATPSDIIVCTLPDRAECATACQVSWSRNLRAEAGQELVLLLAWQELVQPSH